MSTYRKKALEVEAVQWTGENREEVEALLRDGERVRKRSVSGSIEITCALGSKLVAVVRLGHWLIRRRANGPLSTQPPEHFEATYEPADQPGQGMSDCSNCQHPADRHKVNGGCEDCKCPVTREGATWEVPPWPDFFVVRPPAADALSDSVKGLPNDRLHLKEPSPSSLSPYDEVQRYVPASTQPLDLDAKDKRIAELEAESDEMLDVANRNGIDWQKERERAEKAEARLDALKERLTSDEVVEAVAKARHERERAVEELLIWGDLLPVYRRALRGKIRRDLDVALAAAFPNTEQGDG